MEDRSSEALKAKVSAYEEATGRNADAGDAPDDVKLAAWRLRMRGERAPFLAGLA